MQIRLQKEIEIKICFVKGVNHYTYDIHGNVNTLIQDYQNNMNSDERFKRLDYDYDLISGNVHQVTYQVDQPDQWIHKYTYDGDNRIEEVATSADGFIYDTDARYFYYAHGPLARVELGENNVQGMDYAYTIQGWLKGVNSDILDPDNDMGHDGDFDGSNPNGKFAKDAMSFSLGYFAGDYDAIDSDWTTTPADRWLAQTSGSDLIGDRNDLFNGNIGHMVTTILEPDEFTHSGTQQHTIHTQGTVYDYDQLNRLIESRSWQNIDVANNDWDNGTTATDKYKNIFTYDANGNIKTQKRYDGASSPVLLDDLTYKYLEDGSGNRLQNRLYHVNDAIGSGIKTDDIDDMGTFESDDALINSDNNYSYDEIGQLVKDEQEEIANIEWRVDGKIKAIIRETTSSKNSIVFEYDAMGNRIAKKVYEPTELVSEDLDVWISTTIYNRDAQGNVIAVYEYTYDDQAMTTDYLLKERNIYGSSRVGMNTQVVDMQTATDIDENHELGARQYEMSNHLGNVLTVVSDKKIPREIGTPDGTIDAYEPAVLNSFDYTPFGVVQEGRNWEGTVNSTAVSSYRYGFNGCEKDDEVKGEGNSYTTPFRQYDPRLGRWLTIDPLHFIRPFESTYAGFGNNPIYYVDPSGLTPSNGGDDGNYVPEGAPSDAKEGDKFTDASGKNWKFLETDNGGFWARNTGKDFDEYEVKGRVEPTTRDEDGKIVVNPSWQKDWWYDLDINVRAHWNKMLAKNHPWAKPSSITPENADKKITDHMMNHEYYDGAGKRFAAVWSHNHYGIDMNNVDDYAVTAILLPVYVVGGTELLVASYYYVPVVIKGGKVIGGVSQTAGRTIGSALKGFTKHGLNQSITRGFKPHDIIKIMREGKATQAMGRFGPQTRYTLGRNTVITNSDGMVVTVFSDGVNGIFIPF